MHIFDYISDPYDKDGKYKIRLLSHLQVGPFWNKIIIVLL